MRCLGIFRKEMLSLFVSPIAYIIMLVFLLVNGITFYFYLVIFNGDLAQLLRSHFGAIPFWFLSLLVPPLVTMRSFAEERRAGTFELLVTTGVSDTTLVVGKFLAAWTFLMILWLTVIPLFVLLGWVGNLDWGVVLTVHMGLALIGALFTSLGVLASSLTRNQLIAASVSTIGGLLLFFANFFRNFFEVGDFELRYFDYFSPLYHFNNDFTSGIFDLRYLVLYGSVSSFLLFLTVKSLERRRWW